jgi:hypothetical protein
MCPDGRMRGSSLANLNAYRSFSGSVTGILHM